MNLEQAFEIDARIKVIREKLLRARALIPEGRVQPGSVTHKGSDFALRLLADAIDLLVNELESALLPKVVRP